MEKCKKESTPMTTSTYLDLDEKGKSVDESGYKGMIGSLLYLTTSRPDIMLRVCLYVRYHANPKKSHLTAVKRTIKYLKGTTNVGLWYPKSTSLNLIGFSDSYFAGFKLDRKNTTGTCYLLGSSIVSWKKQACVSLSTIEAKYIIVGSCCAQSLWMKQQLEDFGVILDHIPLKCDNISAINVSKNPIMHSRTKHIEIKHHFLRYHISKGDCYIEFVDSENQLVDIFTKPLARDRLFFIRNELGILDGSSIE